MSFMRHHLHSGYANEVFRKWQSVGTEILPHHIMMPFFVLDDDDAKQAIPTMPGVNRVGTNVLLAELDSLVPLGLCSVLLFAVTDLPKDEVGSAGSSCHNPLLRAIKAIKQRFDQRLVVACDICLCPYTSHGHCGIPDPDTGLIDNEASVQRLTDIAMSLARAGADVLAPSDMMDGRVARIKAGLAEHKLLNRVAVLSYSSKFASNLYGPFRDAAHSAPAFGDRKRYQLPAGSGSLGLRATLRDVEQGADFVMVKPALAYLDILRDIKNSRPHIPLFAYQVSGEFAMLHHGAEAGAFDLKATVMEVLTGMRRAGADVIITYFAPSVLQWIRTSR